MTNKPIAIDTVIKLRNVTNSGTINAYFKGFNHFNGKPSTVNVRPVREGHGPFTITVTQGEVEFA